jgi:hypothetical protein
MTVQGMAKIESQGRVESRSNSEELGQFDLVSSSNEFQVWSFVLDCLVIEREKYLKLREIGLVKLV